MLHSFYDSRAIYFDNFKYSVEYPRSNTGFVFFPTLEKAKIFIDDNFMSIPVHRDFLAF